MKEEEAKALMQRPHIPWARIYYAMGARWVRREIIAARKRGEVHAATKGMKFLREKHKTEEGT